MPPRFRVRRKDPELHLATDGNKSQWLNLLEICGRSRQFKNSSVSRVMNAKLLLYYNR